MPANTIAAVMIHVADVAAGLDWYERAFPTAVRARIESVDFDYLRVGHIALEIVPADEKVGAGPFGSVVYWEVPELSAALENMQNVGAKLYRGPLAIENGLGICQVQDPWGNCIGLRGQYKALSPPERITE